MARSSVTAEIMAICFMGAVAAAAHRTGVTLLLFPELAALSHDVLTRPRGMWARQPLRIIVTPTAAALVGLLITRQASYGVVPLLLIVIATLAIIRVLRSAIGPALSAGALPMVLGERHWTYPLAIAVGLGGLVLLLLLWSTFIHRMHINPENTGGDAVDDVMESQSRSRLWLVGLLAFVALATGLGEVTGLRLILFPPLVVMAYEIIGHPELPDWITSPALFPVACLLTAAAGFLACRYFANPVIGVAIAVAASIGILRIFQMRMPPALAISLLPFVIKAPNVWYPVSIGIGSTMLAVWFFASRHLRNTLRHHFQRHLPSS